MGHGDHNDIYFCEPCQHGFLHPFPSSEELAQLYGDVDDELYMEQADGRRRTFDHCLDAFEAQPTTGRLFEIGSYCGLFLKQAQQRGYKVDGIEPSHWAREQCQKNSGVQVHQGLFDADFVKNHPECHEQYEHVVSWDVLEHVEDPVEFCAQAAILLKTGGQLSFSTVNIHSAFTRLLGKRWPWYMQMHLHYFTLPSLKLVLKKAGLHYQNHSTYRHVISCAYFGKKLKALTGLPFDHLLGWGPLKKLYLPFAFGDIVMITATKK
jgi:2-polyprenyl-3-methyl-5-hydroxy-6-metoxy-1,4-benzoquinol methylase